MSRRVAKICIKGMNMAVTGMKKCMVIVIMDIGMKKIIKIIKIIIFSIDFELATSV